MVREALTKKYQLSTRNSSGKSYLMGEQFTVADGYLFTVTNWARIVKFDLTAYPNVLAFQERVRHRPHVQEALRAEGIIK